MRAFARCVRLVDIHHYSPLEVRQAVGYCVQAAHRQRALSRTAICNPEGGAEGELVTRQTVVGDAGVQRRGPFGQSGIRIFKQPPRNL
jgi:hypothetical protein